MEERPGVTLGSGGHAGPSVQITGGTEYGVSMFLNNTGGSLNYTDPLGGVQSLSDGTYDLWFGATSGSLSLLAGGQAKVGSPVVDLDTVVYRVNAAQGAQHSSVWTPVPVPEPGSLALMGLGGLVLVGLWRRSR